LVAATSGKVHWRTRILHLALVILTVIKYLNAAAQQPATANVNVNNNGGKSTG
jgi:hypothetical protein